MSLEAIAAFFDRRAPTYDGIASHQWMARRLVELAAPPLGAEVLDVATGTGLAARAAGRAVGASGRVVGVDISPGMLAEARAQVSKEGLANVELRLASADELPFKDASFDAVFCVSSIPFFPSAAAAFREWRRVLRGDGTVGFTGLEEDPLTSHRVLRLVAYREAGIAITDPNAALGTKERAVHALHEAHFDNIDVVIAPYLQPFADPDAAWQGTVQHPLSSALRALPADLLERVRSAFLREYGARYRAEAEDTVRVLFVTARCAAVPACG